MQELISRGEEVVYFTIEAFRERIEKTGATVRTFDGEKFIKAFISGGRNYLHERMLKISAVFKAAFSCARHGCNL